MRSVTARTRRSSGSDCRATRNAGTLAIAFAVLLLAGTRPVDAQQDAPATYRLGAGDVLEVRILGLESLTATLAIGPDGGAAVPLVGSAHVAGLTVPELTRRLTSLLERDFLLEPRVEVRIKQRASEYVLVGGEVNLPGQRRLSSATSLADVLVASGGFTPSASGKIVVTRSAGEFADGSRVLRLHLGRAGGPAGERLGLETPIRHGDEITLLARRFIVVTGEVLAPHRYDIDGELTLSSALEKAGGLTAAAGRKVLLQRVDEVSGEATTLEFDIEAIHSGEAEDPRLEVDDRVTVTRRRF